MDHRFPGVGDKMCKSLQYFELENREEGLNKSRKKVNKRHIEPERRTALFQFKWLIKLKSTNNVFAALPKKEKEDK